MTLTIVREVLTVRRKGGVRKRKQGNWSCKRDVCSKRVCTPMVAEHVAQWHHVRRFRGLEGKKVQMIRKKAGSEDQKERRFKGSEVQKKVGGSN